MRATTPITYVGPSMNPTFRTRDVLEYEPVTVSGLRRGDIIVHVSPERPIRVIHRVIAVHGERVRTRGDNNGNDDPYTLTGEDILGRVVSATRGKKRLHVHNGMAGRVQAGYYRMKKSLRNNLVLLVQPLYSFLSEHRLISRWTARWLNIRVAEFERPAGRERYATLYGRVVAHIPPRSDMWRIQPPYRVFIDDSLLPASDAQ